MTAMKDKSPHRFHMHETDRMLALEGLPLAAFWQRALGYVVDVSIAVVLWAPLEALVRRNLLHQEQIDLKWDFHETGNIVVMVLYWAACNYFGNGRTPGKWVARNENRFAHQRPARSMAIDRARPRLRSRNPGRRPGIRSILLGSQPDVRARSPGRDDCH
jgi:hypothetical protein